MLFLLYYANCYIDFKLKIITTQHLDIQLNSENTSCLSCAQLREVVLLLGRTN